MNRNITGKARRQYQSITTPPISDDYVSDLLREMAKLDDFDARNLTPDVSPCESEYPDEVHVSYEREPVGKDVVMGVFRIVYAVLMAGTIIAGLWFVAWLMG